MRNVNLQSASRAFFGACLSFLTFTSLASAQVCADLFEIESSRKIVRETRELKKIRGKVSIDPQTKQERHEGFAAIRDGRELYVDFLAPAPGKPIIVLANGLTYRTGIWDTFVKNLKGNGLGILRWDPVGMGRTMEKHGPPKGPVTITDQVRDLKSLLESLGIDQKIHMLGLSYGGGLAIEFTATYPQKVETLIAMAAYTAPLESQVNQIMTQIAATRFFFPLNPATDAQLYSFFLKQIVYTTYPLTESIVLEHPYKLESVFRMAEGATSFNALNFVHQLPKGVLHQIDAGKDQYIPLKVPDAFWAAVPEAARASRMILYPAEHKIPEAWPHFSAEWVKLIIAKDPRIQDGKTWEGSGFTDRATDGRTKIKVP